jgi:recombination protein RecA
MCLIRRISVGVVFGMQDGEVMGVSKLEEAVKKIHKDHGTQSLVWLTGGPAEKISVIPTGALSLDIALGCGGYPRGRIVELMGWEASGKTSLALHAIAEVQKAGGTAAAFIDAEHALDLGYAQALGVKTDDLLFSQPDCGEQALNIADELVSSGALQLIVIDSVAALVPKVELEGEVGDAHIGLQARMMSQALRKMCSMCSKTGTTVMFINQFRQKIGVMFGSNQTTAGGNALKFYASVRLDVKKKEQVQGADGPTGNNILVKVIKNKLAPPFKEAELEVVWGRGINRLGDLLGVAIREGVVGKSGAWLSYGDQRLGQGVANASKRLLDDAALAKGLEEELRRKIGL